MNQKFLDACIMSGMFYIQTPLNEPPHGQTNDLPRRKQRRRSAKQ